MNMTITTYYINQNHNHGPRWSQWPSPGIPKKGNPMGWTPMVFCPAGGMGFHQQVDAIDLVVLCTRVPCEKKTGDSRGSSPPGVGWWTEERVRFYWNWQLIDVWRYTFILTTWQVWACIYRKKGEKPADLLRIRNMLGNFPLPSPKREMIDSIHIPTIPRFPHVKVPDWSLCGTFLDRILREGRPSRNPPKKYLPKKKVSSGSPKSRLSLGAKGGEPCGDTTT